MMSSNSALLTLWRVSPALAKVIKAETVTRAEAVKGIWAHIKDNELQDKVTRTMINNDEDMVAVFGKPSMKQTEIMGGIGKHLLEKVQ